MRRQTAIRRLRAYAERELGTTIEIWSSGEMRVHGIYPGAAGAYIERLGTVVLRRGGRIETLCHELGHAEAARRGEAVRRPAPLREVLAEERDATRRGIEIARRARCGARRARMLADERANQRNHRRVARTDYGAIVLGVTPG